jgi:DNA-binding NarL/FixJ family response regulator
MFEYAATQVHELGIAEVASDDPTVVIVDEHILFMEAIAFALSKARLHVVGMARGGDEAVNMVRALQPDIVLVDLHLPDRGGIEVGQEIMAAAPSARVIGMSYTEDHLTVRTLRRLGFAGFVPKSTRVSNVVDAIRSGDPGAAWLAAEPPPPPVARPRRRVARGRAATTTGRAPGHLAPAHAA